MVSPEIVGCFIFLAEAEEVTQISPHLNILNLITDGFSLIRLSSSAIYISWLDGLCVFLHDMNTISVSDFECFFVDSLTGTEQLQTPRFDDVGVYHKAEFERQLKEETLGP